MSVLDQTNAPWQAEHAQLQARIAELEQHISELESTLAESSDDRHRLLRIVEQSPSAIVITDRSGVIEYVNPRFSRVTGYSFEEVVGQNPRVLKSGDTPPEEYRQLWETILAGNEWRGEFHNRRKDGALFWEFASISPLFDSDGNITHFLSIKEDITERKQFEWALNAANEQLTSTVARLEQHNNDMILLNRLSDMLQQSVTVAEACTVAAQCAAQLFSGQSGAIYLRNVPTSEIELAAHWGHTSPESLQTLPEECRAMVYANYAPGTLDHSSCLCNALTVQGEQVGILQICCDPRHEHHIYEHWRWLAGMMSEHLSLTLANLRLREHLHAQSIRDPLTGLFNRRYQDETLERELRRARRHGYAVGIIMLDIDHFKQFNTDYLHDGGDALLRAMGQFLQTCIRGEDIAGRYGGDEFTLILPGATLADTQRRAEQIRTDVQRLRIRHDGRLMRKITISAGVAVFTSHGNNDDAVIKAADSALYRAKAAGRNRVVVADQATVEKAEPLPESLVGRGSADQRQQKQYTGHKKEQTAPESQPVPIAHAAHHEEACRDDEEVPPPHVQ